MIKSIQWKGKTDVQTNQNFWFVLLKAGEKNYNGVHMKRTRNARQVEMM